MQVRYGTVQYGAVQYGTVRCRGKEQWREHTHLQSWSQWEDYFYCPWARTSWRSGGRFGLFELRLPSLRGSDVAVVSKGDRLWYWGLDLFDSLHTRDKVSLFTGARNACFGSIRKSPGLAAVLSAHARRWLIESQVLGGWDATGVVGAGTGRRKRAVAGQLGRWQNRQRQQQRSMGCDTTTYLSQGN
jgi:hypothetical protein